MSGVIVSILLSALIAYLWGSIPSGYWIGKLLRGTNFDIRQYGSNRIGATNVARTLGKVPAVVVLIVDISKGIGPALLTTSVPFLYGNGWGPSIAGIAALLGHCFPLFIRFKGGRGVSTGGGALLVISPLIFLFSLITMLSTIAIWRYVSLGSIIGCVTTLVCGIIFYFFFIHISLAQLVFLTVSPLIIILFHADNIKRLLAGTESKLGQKVATTGNNREKSTSAV